MNAINFYPKSQAEGFLAEIDPRIKIPIFFALVITVIVTPSSQFLKFGLLLAALLILAMYARISFVSIFWRLLLVSAMVIFIGALVFCFQHRPAEQNWMVVWNIFIKTVLVVIILSVLTQSTEFYRLIKALESFKIPRLIVSLLGFTYRYLQALVGESITVKRAIDSRSFGRRSKMETIRILESALLHLFFRTFERSERVYAAMLSRGYDGTISRMDDFCVKRSDLVFIGVVIIFLIIFLVVI